LISNENYKFIVIMMLDYEKGDGKHFV